jgi:hypothetical protein
MIEVKLTPGMNYVFTMTQDDLVLTHAFPAIGVWKAQDKRAFFANQLQRLIDKWEANIGPISEKDKNYMMEAIIDA